MIGITGHQAREGLDWLWTRSMISAVLLEAAPVGHVLTSLAVGTDQVFAEEALALAIELKAVLPFAGYERCFVGEGLASYRLLLSRSSKVVVMSGAATDQEAFLAAGMQIANECNLLVAVWDGKPAAGLGGTADVVRYALTLSREIIHLDPFRRAVRRLPAGSTL